MFAGFHDDTLPSIVLLHSRGSEQSKEQVVARCKDDLMTVAMPEAVIRSHRSKLNHTNEEEVQKLYGDYFEKPIHNGFKAFLERTLTIHQESGYGLSGMQLLVMTHSSVHTDVKKCIECLDLFQVQIVKLSSIKSEKALSMKVKHFWTEPTANLLVVQCRPETDAPHMLLMKTIIEEQNKAFVESRQSYECQKHVCIVVHVHRSIEVELLHHRWEFNYLSGWSQVMIDSLEQPPIEVKKLLSSSVVDVIKLGTVPFTQVAAEQMFWCFTRMKLPLLKQPDFEYISSLVETITSSNEIKDCFMNLCCSWIKSELKGSKFKWKIDVACDRQILINSSTLVNAMKYFITRLVRRPLAKIVYFLQKHSALDAVTSENLATRQECLKLMSNETVFKISDVPEPQGPESLVVDFSHPGLRFPFSHLFCKRMDNLYDYFREEYRRHCFDENNLDENEELTRDARKVLVTKIAVKVEQVITEIMNSEILSHKLPFYVDDFLDIKSDDVSDVLNRNERVTIMKAHFGDKMPSISDSQNDVPNVIAQLHCNLWLGENSIPPVLYFVKDCTSTSLDIDDFLRRYWDLKANVQVQRLNEHSSEDHLNLSLGEHSSKKCNEEQAEENDEHLNQPEEHDDDNDLQFPIQESQLDDCNERINSEDVAVQQNDDGDSDSGGGESAHNEGSGDDAILDADKQPDFEEFLVQQVCFSFLPTDAFLTASGGIKEWKNAAILVLSSAALYCYPGPAYYYLKVCTDFARLGEPKSLSALAEVGHKVVDENYLDSPMVFKAVCNIIESLRGKGQDDQTLDELVFLFYERCIQSNPDSPMNEDILKKLSICESEHMFPLASSLLSKVLLTEYEIMAFSMENVEQLMTSTNLSYYPNLMEINVVLSQLQENGKELDCHINVICCDLINKLAFKDLDFKKLSSSDDPAIKNYHKAMDVLTEPGDDCKKNVFGFICAVSYLRAFMSHLSRTLNEAQSPVLLDLLLCDICNRLKEDETLTRKSSVSRFFLKQLCQVMCLYDVQQIIQKCNHLHCLKCLGWKESDPSNKLYHNPLTFHAADSSKALVLYAQNKDPKPLKNALDSLEESAEKRKEFSAVIMERFYFVRSVRKLKDTEDSVAKFVTEHLTQVSPPYKNFIARIAGRESFKCPQLEMSPQSSAMNVEVAVLIQHLCAILTSCFTGEIKNPIMSCLANPTELKESYMLASPDDVSGYPLFKHFKTSATSNVHFLSCKCGTRFASYESVATKCPCCDSPGREDIKGAKENYKAAKGYVKCSLESLQSDMLHVRNLDPIEFRILHLLIHATLLAGYSLELSIDALPDVMKDENPSGTCYEIIKMDLDVLSNLLCCKKEIVITLLHHVIDELFELLTKDGSNPLPHDTKARFSWETDFADKVQAIIYKFGKGDSIPVPIGYDDASMKAVISENQLPQFADVDERNASIPRLLRFTEPNTFNKLREIYLNSPKDVKEKHQLLGLFLDYHDTLHFVGNLAALISWNRRVDILLSRSLTRSVAKEKSILDAVIEKEQQLQQGDFQAANGDSTRKECKEFIKAWESVVDFINAKIQDGDNMPYISQLQPIGYCLAEKQGLGGFLCRCLIILAEMQNEFLDKCLAIASSGKCPALHFLFKGRSSVPSFPVVHIQDAKRKEIICYEWTDNFLDYSFCATEYGQGKNITYEMEKIEKELAGRFLLGKAYLDTTSGIREFVFSKELFHDCANILNELCEAIPQEKLPSSVEAELGASGKRSMDRIQILLEHLELVLCYLKRLQIKPDESLAEYIDTWMCSSRPFPKDLLPTALNTIQIKHCCALYEFVEDQLAIPSVGCVGKKYRRKMKDETATMMRKHSQTVDKVVLEAVITAIKRFAFRYLHMNPHPDKCLLEFMRDPSLWPMALRVKHDDIAFKVPEAAPKLFPEGVTVGQTYEVYRFYQDVLKEINNKPSKSRLTSEKPKPSRGPKKGRARNLFS